MGDVYLQPRKGSTCSSICWLTGRWLQGLLTASWLHNAFRQHHQTTPIELHYHKHCFMPCLSRAMSSKATQLNQSFIQLGLGCRYHIDISHIIFSNKITNKSGHGQHTVYLAVSTSVSGLIIRPRGTYSLPSCQYFSVRPHCQATGNIQSSFSVSTLVSGHGQHKSLTICL